MEFLFFLDTERQDSNAPKLNARTLHDTWSLKMKDDTFESSRNMVHNHFLQIPRFPVGCTVMANFQPLF